MTTNRFQFVLPVDGDEESPVEQPKFKISRERPIRPNQTRDLLGAGDEKPGRVETGPFRTYEEILAEKQDNTLYNHVTVKLDRPTRNGQLITYQAVATGCGETVDEDPAFVDNRRRVFAAARLLRDSRVLSNWTDEDVADRAVVAMAYVRAKEYRYGGKLTFDGASADDFDNRYETVTAEDWDDFADVKADDMIDDAKSSGELVIPEGLDYYYDFDYESWRKNSKSDYEVIDLSDTEETTYALLILRAA